MLHYLCHTLNSLGCEAYVTHHETNPKLWTPVLTPQIAYQHKTSGQTPIAVYPEVVPGNPLGLAVVARWLMNRAGHLLKHKDFAPDELIFYWGEWVLDGEENAVRLFFPGVDRSVFNWKGVIPENRQGFCYYAHKYIRAGNRVSERLTQNGISLCQDIPRSKEEIAGILRTSRVLYCYEPSAISIEAISCGCPVIYIDTDYLRQFDEKFEAMPIPYLKVQESKLDFSFIPDLDHAAFDAWMETTAKQSFLSVLRFIEITQAAASAQAEKGWQPGYRLNNAISAFNAQQTEEAMALFSSLLDELPENPLPSAYLAFLCAQMGLPDGAHDFIQKAIQIAPERADLVAALGESFLKSSHPELAAGYLREAIHIQPDLFAAYPALAQSLHLTGKSEEAVSLLQAVSSISSGAQSNIQSVLLQILVECGDLSEFAKYSQRFSHGLPDDLLTARCLARFEENGEAFIETLSRIQAQLEGVLHSGRNRTTPPKNDSGMTRIAFMAGDFTSHHQLEQLFAFFRYLPVERFFTIFICCHTNSDMIDITNRVAPFSDTIVDIRQDEDDRAVEKILAATPDILINMEVCSPSERLAVFLVAPVPHKFLWGEAPLPPIAPDVRILAGARLAVEQMLPTVTLPEMGEVFDLPELPFTDPAAPKMGNSSVFGCLLPAAGIARNGWQLFAETLRQHPEATLVINLEKLGQPAQNFICGQFSGAEVDPARLVFIRIRTAEEFCLAWQSIDLGLLPPVNPGGLALPTCLWMGRPCLVPDAILPWSQRPVALLRALGKEAWIAPNAPHYADLARQLAPPGARVTPDPVLRERMKALGLIDASGFAQNFAEAMTALLQNNPSIPPATFDGPRS